MRNAFSHENLGAVCCACEIGALNITGDHLEKFYEVSGARIRYLRGKGAPVENPDAFFEWWQENQGRHGALYWSNLVLV